MPNETSGVSGMGDRYNNGKLRYSLVSIPALTELVKVLEFGAKKYDAWNWSKGLSWTDTYDSLDRHMKKWMSGEDNDQETGLSHAAHAMCNAMFLLHFIMTGTGKDDRPAAHKNNNNAEEKIGTPSTFEEFIQHVEHAVKRHEPRIKPVYDCTYGIPYERVIGAGTYAGPVRAQDPVVPGGVSDLQAYVRPAGTTVGWYGDQLD